MVNQVSERVDIKVLRDKMPPRADSHLKGRCRYVSGLGWRSSRLVSPGLFTMVGMEDSRGHGEVIGT